MQNKNKTYQDLFIRDVDFICKQLNLIFNQKIKHINAHIFN